MTPPTSPRPRLPRWRVWIGCAALITLSHFAAPTLALGSDPPLLSAAPLEGPVTRYGDPTGDTSYWDVLPMIDASACFYWTRAVAYADVDGDGAADDVAVVTHQRRGKGVGEIVRAYLLVGERDGEAVFNRSVTVLFDESDRASYGDCPLIYPLVDWEAGTTDARMDLVDLTGDDIPEVCFYTWTTSMSIPVYLSVLTYRDGEFVPILRRRCQSRMGTPRYGDQDGDGAGDIIMSNAIVVDGRDTASDPNWVSVFEWNGEEFIDDTESYHAADEELMAGYIRRYEFNKKRDRAANRRRYYHEYEFYMGMIHLYKGELDDATRLLTGVAGKAEREVFQDAARDVLSSMEQPAPAPRGLEADVTRFHDPMGDSAYWDFLPAIDASAYWYWTRATARADVDGDGAPDDIALVSLQRRGSEFGTVARAYLLIGDRDGDEIANRSVTVLYDETDRPEYEDCPLIYPLMDWEVDPTHAWLDLVDLTGDGVPEVCFYPWILGNASPIYLSVHTYRDNELVPILRRRCYSRAGRPQYGDQDGDGAGDIILSNTIVVKGTDTASDPDWASVFEWNGEEFVDDTKSYYAADDELMAGYVRRYESNKERDAAVGYERYYHEYEFYMGMIHLHRGELDEATHFLKRVSELAKREVFQGAARDVLLDMARAEDGR